MIRFALVGFSALAAFAGLMWISSAHAQLLPGHAAVTGEWTGRYVCTQGVTALELDIDQGAGRQIVATFSFGPLPENPDIPKGAYRMQGTYDPATRRVKLQGSTWINAPAGYVMVGLDGHMAASGATITGVRARPVWLHRFQGQPAGQADQLVRLQATGVRRISEAITRTMTAPMVA